MPGIAVTLPAYPSYERNPMSITTTTGGRPTIVLVHGAFADSSSWDRVIAALLHDDYP
jgi:pimeloyl-ACP methyl ester carboxylesterase